MSSEQRFLDAISEAISGAPPEWLRALRTSIDHQLVSERDFSEDEREVWSAITSVLVNPYPKLLGSFVKIYGANKYREAVDHVMDLARQGGSDRLNKTARMALLTIMFQCLVEHMSTRVPRTPKTLVSMVGHLPNAIDAAFPGYLEAGLLHRVMRAA